MGMLQNAYEFITKHKHDLEESYKATESDAAPKSAPKKKKKKLKSFKPYIRDFVMSDYADEAKFLKSIGENPKEYDLSPEGTRLY